MKLREALTKAGVSQAELAEVLGVSKAAVSKWVRQEKPIPEGRVEVIETFLVMEEGSLETGGDARVRFTFDSAPTMLGFLVLALDAGRLSPVETMERIAAHFPDVEVEDVEAWSHGQRRLPLGMAKKLADAFWPKMNPVVFAHEVGRLIPESEAVRSAISKTRLNGVESFEDLADVVARAEAEWRADPTRAISFEAASNALDNGRNVPTRLRDQMGLVARRRNT